MPLYTRGSQATVTSFGPSTANNSPARTHRSPMNFYRSPALYRRPEENHSRSDPSSSFSSTSVMASTERSDSDTESDVSTGTDISEAFLKQKLLQSYTNRPPSAKTELSGKDSLVSDPTTTVSYSLEDRPKWTPRPRKELFAFSIEGTGAISGITQLSGDEAVIFRVNDKVVHVYHRNGQRKNSRALGYRVESMRMRQDNVFMVLPYQAQSLLRTGSSPFGQPVAVAHFELEIGGFCCTSRSETLLTTKHIEKSQKKKPRPRTTPSVIRLSQAGETIWEIKSKDADAFVKPTKIACNVNGDICVIDKVPERDHVVILSPDGREMHRYYGTKHPMLSHPFDPKDICCDKSGNIYIVDLHSSAVHVLDKHGVFNHFLCTMRDGISCPTAIMADADGYIWVGCASGKIFVYKTS